VAMAGAAAAAHTEEVYRHDIHQTLRVSLSHTLAHTHADDLDEALQQGVWWGRG
jgi:hypothetical protein